MNQSDDFHISNLLVAPSSRDALANFGQACFQSLVIYLSLANQGHGMCRVSGLQGTGLRGTGYKLKTSGYKNCEGKAKNGGWG